MSYNTESRSQKTLEELNDERNTVKLRKHIKNDKWIRLKELAEALEIGEAIADYILSTIMKNFWEGEYNLYFDSSESEVLKGNKYSDLIEIMKLKLLFLIIFKTIRSIFFI